jgi:putative inorganic carbon (hco3(-)) transporter
MGIVATVLFLLLAYISPMEIFPAIAPYRPQIFMAVLALVAGIPSALRNPYNLRVPQAYLLLGMFGAVAFSRLANRFLGASVSAIIEFSTAALCFYFVLFNANSIRLLRVLAATVVAIAIYLTLQGMVAYVVSPEQNMFVLFENVVGQQGYLETVKRIRGAGFLADPNDLAQFLLIAMALLGMGWRRGGMFRLIFVIFPGLILFAGMAMTRSRGGLLGLLLLLALVFQSRLGKVKSAFLSTFLGLGLLAANFTGNRAISMGAGADRLDTWREGWGMFRSSPIWGVGYGWFTHHYHYTAHNSFVLCFAELGLLGYFFWMALIVFSLYQLGAILRIEAKTQTQLDVQRWARAMRVALYAFIVTGWFLSRTYTITFYLLVGMVASLTAIMYNETHSSDLLPKWKWTFTTVAAELGTILLLYTTLKLRSMV